MSKNDKFFDENNKNQLMNVILNTNYNDEEEVWELALKLEHISIVLRSNVLEKSDE